MHLCMQLYQFRYNRILSSKRSCALKIGIDGQKNGLHRQAICDYQRVGAYTELGDYSKEYGLITEQVRSHSGLKHAHQKPIMQVR